MFRPSAFIGSDGGDYGRGDGDGMVLGGMGVVAAHKRGDMGLLVLLLLILIVGIIGVGVG